MLRYGLLLTFGFVFGIMMIAQLYESAHLSTYFRRSHSSLDFRVTSFNITSSRWMNKARNKAYSNYGDRTCRKLADHDMMSFLFRSWIALAKHLDVTYSLAQGSLLGAWRDGNMIPYDTDIDVYIPIQDMNKMERFFLKNKSWSVYNGHRIYLTIQRDWRLPQDERRRISCDGKLTDRLVDGCSFIEPVARLVILDRFFVDVFAYTINYDILHPYTDECIYIKLNDYFPTNRCMFMDTETYCPRKPEVILKKLYGKLEPQVVCQNTLWIKTKERSIEDKQNQATFVEDVRNNNNKR